MATSSIKKLNGGPLRSNIPGLYVLVVEMEISTTTITSTDPVNAKEFTVAHAGTTGDYTITFNEDLKPRNVWAGFVAIEEDLPEESALWTGYTRSTGVGTFSFYDEDDTSGIATQADFTGTAKLVLLCSNSSLSD
jgi:hypothetical protein